MKRLVEIISGVVVGVSCMAGVAAADSSCPAGTIVNGNGTGSSNTISCTTTNDTHVTCVNDIYVVGQNGQAASTGTAAADGNTTTGVVVSGNATNDSNTTVQVGASCGAQVAQATTPATFTPPVGGQGAGAATPVAPAAAAAVTTLPKTGNSALVGNIVTGVAIAASLMAVSQLGVQAYRRLALK